MRFHLLCLALTLLVGASTGYAQADLQAAVPFDFHAGKRVLPAGEYLFDIDNSGLVWISSGHDGARSVVGSIGAGKADFSEDSKLVFLRYGRRYFLSELWREGSSNGRRIKTTPTEADLAKSMPAKTVSLRASR